ncbi:MAG: DNA-binding protein [Methylovulum sp.]|nr:DNA-binding protein [Methylovulum sp.]
MQKTLTPEEVKNQFKARGEPISQWAKSHGYPLNRVYRVLNGQDKAYWGKGHDIAVALGMKTNPDQPAA